jgi:hypothetical protein
MQSKPERASKLTERIGYAVRKNTGLGYAGRPVSRIPLSAIDALQAQLKIAKHLVASANPM